MSNNAYIFAQLNECLGVVDMVTKVVPTNEQRDESIEVISSMVELLGLECEVIVTEVEGGFACSLKTEEPGQVIGRKGQYLDSLEMVFNRILRKKFEDFPWVEVNVEGYRKKGYQRRNSSSTLGKFRNKNYDKNEQNEKDEDKQENYDNRADTQTRTGIDEERLKKIAIDAAKEVKKWGESKQLGPYSSMERRIIHTTLADDQEIDTSSIECPGKKAKKIVIKLVSE